MTRLALLVALSLAAISATPAAAGPPAHSAGLHSCPGWLPYAGYDGYPKFWRSVEARATPCKAARQVARQAVADWSGRRARTNFGRVIRLSVRLAGGAHYRCRFAWTEVANFEAVNNASCKARAGKLIRWRSVPAGD